MAVNKEYDREILSGVLLRCTPTNIRQHLTLSMGPGTTYSGLKESLLSYERASRSWDVDGVMRQVQGSDMSSKQQQQQQIRAPLQWRLTELKKGKDGKATKEKANRTNLARAGQVGQAAGLVGKEKAAQERTKASTKANRSTRASTKARKKRASATRASNSSWTETTADCVVKAATGATSAQSLTQPTAHHCSAQIAPC